MTPIGQAGSMLATAKKEEPVYEGRELGKAEAQKGEKRRLLKWLLFYSKNSHSTQR
jgi:hypothetical protein